MRILRDTNTLREDTKMTGFMKSLQCDAPHSLTLVERARPDDVPGQVRLRIAAIGICGTDYHIYGGNQPFLEYPRVMGHELSAYALTDSTDGRITKGDLVVVNPYLSCGLCRACTSAKGDPRVPMRTVRWSPRAVLSGDMRGSVIPLL